MCGHITLPRIGRKSPTLRASIPTDAIGATISRCGANAAE
jgi:hypothetical protein